MITRKFNESWQQDCGIDGVRTDIELCIYFKVDCDLETFGCDPETFDFDEIVTLLDKIENQISARPHNRNIFEENVSLNVPSFLIKPDDAVPHVDVCCYLGYNCTMCLNKHDDTERVINALYDELDGIFSSNFSRISLKQRDPAIITAK